MSSSADWNFGTDNFTIDFWVYLTGNPDNDYIFDIGSNNHFLRMFGSNPKWDFYAGGVYVFQYDVLLSKNAWHHIAIVRSATTTTKLYIDGTLVATYSSSYSFGSSSLALTVGNYGGRGAYAANAYIEEFRISNIARWTADFTPPTSAYS